MATTAVYNDLYPSYGDLPFEIILEVFSFLEHSDLQAAGATCSRWRQALFQFNDNTMVRLSKVCFSDRFPPATHLMKCNRPLRSFHMEDITFGQVQQTMAHIGKTATDMSFENVDMGDKQFYAIMSQLPKLRSLSVSRCSPLFMSGYFLDNYEDRMTVDMAFASIKHLSLCNNQYLSDAILLRITALINEIETLNMSGCHIAYHNAVQRRFYPQDNIVSPSESILTFKFIMRVLEGHCPFLRELNFSHTLIGGSSLLALCELDNGGLKLHRLRLAGCRQLNTMGVTTFLDMQPQLVVLDLSETNCVTDECIESVVTSTPLLEELSLASCSGITNDGAAHLGTLKHLRKLNISRCEGITSDGIIRGIAQVHNTVLRELEMESLNVNEECVKLIAKRCPELRLLNVGHCVNGVTDESVQCIIENLRWLRVLSLENCFWITDTALTGINISKLGLQKASTSSLENFNPPPTSCIAERESLSGSMQSMKISLRSKAEEDIIRDAHRKKAMFTAFELNLIKESHIEGHVLKHLRGLKALNLKGCNKITDVSLKYGLGFNALKRLVLCNCQQISFVGMEALAQSCPSIEELDLSDCYNINDKAIQVLTTKLTRLRKLLLNGCSQLTDHSLDAIFTNCNCLQSLSVHRCRSMYTDIEERLSQMPSLRTLNIDNTSSMDNAELFRLKKRLDY